MTKTTTLLGALAVLLAACSGLVPPPPESSPAHLRPDQAPGTGPIPRVVEQAPFLPPPVAAPPTEKYTVVVHEVPVKELLFALARDAAVKCGRGPGDRWDRDAQRHRPDPAADPGPHRPPGGHAL